MILLSDRNTVNEKKGKRGSNMNGKVRTGMEHFKQWLRKGMAVKAAALLLGMFCMMPAMKAEAAANPKITVKSVTKLTETNAQINAVIKNSGKVRLKKCGFLLYNSRGKLLANRYDKINYTKTSFNGWFDLNSYYGKLTSGTTYRYRFYVMNDSNKYFYSSVKSFTTKKAAQATVTVKAVSGLSDTTAQLNATVNNPGKLTLKKCGYLLYHANGRLLSNRYDTINYKKTSFNAWFELNSYYGALTPSTTYKYKIYVVDSSGKYYYSAMKSFQTSKKAAESTTKKLSYSGSAIKKIGAQPKGSLYCSVYAISYARAAAGKTPYENPMAYWKNGLAYWSKGGMKSTKYSTQQTALKAVYDQIKAGKPAILYVYGPKASQHYVTVIGYQNVTNVNSLTMRQFICLDPGDAKEKSLGTYTAPKMTYKDGKEAGYQVVVF